VLARLGGRDGLRGPLANLETPTPRARAPPRLAVRQQIKQAAPRERKGYLGR